MDVDRENLIKIKSDLQNNSDNTQQNLVGLQGRMLELELQVRREESIQKDLQTKLRRSEEQSQELANFIKGLSN